MFKRTQICTGVLAAMGALALPALAQTVERIEVTGSRIKTIGAVSNSPVTSVSAEEFNSSQPVAAEEIIRSLSAAYPGIGPNTNNGSGGIASVDLRGLGTNRTLVLINGRRAVPANLLGVVDTNAIPVSLIDRIDVITGGASAVYGADAVAGVVNFVMKRNFTGIEAGASLGTSSHDDGKKRNAYVTFGSNLADGRGNVAVNLSTTRTDPVLQGDRDFSREVLFSADGGFGARSGTAVPSVLVGVPGFGGNRVYDSTTGTLRTAGVNDLYNFNPVNYFQTPQERTQISALASFRINDFAEAYADLTSTKNRVVLSLAESGSFTTTYSLPIGNPYIPDPLRAILCTAYGITTPCALGNTEEVRLRIQRRFVELGPRGNDFDNNTQQWTLGLRGALPFGDWSYDGYMQKGESSQQSVRRNWGSFSKLQQSLRSVNATTCTVNTNGCVPINMFGPAGSITPAMLNFINLSSIGSTRFEQSVANFSVSGDLGPVKSPFSKLPFSVALGAETREVVASNVGDAPTQIGGEVLGTGAATPDRRGSLKLNEGFVEANLPLANGITGINSLSVELGYRATDFKTEATSSNYSSWKVGLDYAPIKGVRFRAMQQRATRAPSINELYAPVVTGLSNLGTDPCAGASLLPANISTPGSIEALCVATGVPASQIGLLAPPSAGQINATSGGNLALGPEEADTTTIGVVFEPTLVPGLTMTVDYYKIDLQKAVSSATTLQVMNGCYTAALNPGLSSGALFCGFIRRDPFGSLNGGPGVITQSSNLGTFLTEGVDLDIDYRLPLKNIGLANWGTVQVGVKAALVSKFDFKSLPTVATIPLAGNYGLNSGNPYFKTKFTQSAKWDIGSFSVGYQWKHQSRVNVDAGTGTFFEPYRSIKAYDYVDLNGYYDVTKNFRVSVTVNNAFDKQPPVVGNTIGGTGPNSGNTFPQAYDAIGRFVSLAARLKF
jgi:outer membrane receptor protein involved in Fe transport